jgi:biotin transport system substrate-specific component
MESGIHTRSEAAPLVGARTISVVLWVGGFALATALAAQVRIPLPGTPVPITLQTMVVLAAGIALGPWPGALAMGVYLAAGAAGAPVFTGLGAGWYHLTGATAGYLVALPAAAWLVGRLAARGERHRDTWLAALAGEALILLMGTLWLALFYRQDLATAAALGALPFVVGDLVKTGVAAEAGRLLRRRT